MSINRVYTLYKHYNKNGDLLYVGISNNHINRLFQHSVNVDWFKEVTRVELTHFDSRREAIDNEKLSIIKEKPLYNKVFNSENGRARFYNLQHKAALVDSMEFIESLDLCKPDNFKAARVALKYGQSDLARALNTPLRTVQDWERGARRIPGVAGVAVGLLIERDARIMEQIRANIGARLDRKYPNGIISEPDPEEAEE